MSLTDSARRSKLAVLLAAAVVFGLSETPLAAQSRADSREDVRKSGTSSPVQGAPTKAPAVAPALPPARSPSKDPPLKVFLSDDGQTLYLVGMILDGSFHQVDEVLRKAPKAKRVHLSSAGGYTIEARLIAALVRKRKLDTYVEFYCASACTQVFAAGRDRVLGPHAQLGFHQAVMVDPSGKPIGVRKPTDRKLSSTLVFGVNGNDTLRLAYELAGVSPAFIEKALSFENKNMWLPSPAELLEAKVVTRQAERSELPSPPGSGVTREAVQAQLLQLPLWRAAKARIPQIAEKAMDEVWRIANSGYSIEAAINAGRGLLIDAGSKELTRAPDIYLDRALKFYADTARSERAQGYPGCKSLDGEATDKDQRSDAEFTVREDEVFAGLLMSEERVPAMEQEEATRFFAREVLPKLTGFYREGYSSGRAGHCRLGFQTFEAIDNLPAKKRLRAYRALLSMTAAADD
jgi:hypothetical protein